MDHRASSETQVTLRLTVFLCCQIRSKQDFGSSIIDHVSKNNQKKNAQLAPKKPFPTKPFRSREIIAQPQANTPPPLSLLRQEICPRSSRALLHLLLLPEGTASLQEPCRASGTAFLAQTVFNLEHNEKLDLQTLGKIPRSACRFLLHKYNKDLDSLPGFPHVSKGTPPPAPQQLKGLYKALSRGIYCRINASFFKIKQI